MTGAPTNSLAAAELGSRFTDLRVVRAGSRFTIYEGRELGANRMIVVKVPHHGSPWLNDVIEREAELLSAISSHPHVVTLYQRIALDDGRPALLLERCVGTLSDAMHRDDEVMSVQDVVATGIKLAGALETVHRNGVLHCDVRPRTPGHRTGVLPGAVPPRPVRVREGGEPTLAGFDEAVEITALGARPPMH